MYSSVTPTPKCETKNKNNDDLVPGIPQEINTGRVLQLAVPKFFGQIGIRIIFAGYNSRILSNSFRKRRTVKVTTKLTT